MTRLVKPIRRTVRLDLDARGHRVAAEWFEDECADCAPECKELDR